MTPKPLAPGVSAAMTPHSLHPASNGAGAIPGFHTKHATSKEAASYVGFANIPNQVFRRAIKRGFDFTLMVVGKGNWSHFVPYLQIANIPRSGQSGLGKSTFVNTLFMTEVNEPLKENGYRPPSTLKIDVRTVRLVENGVNLNLTLVDTPGFGDFVDNSKWHVVLSRISLMLVGSLPFACSWEPIVDFIDRKYLDYFSEETKIERSDRIPDHRVHLCLYFIAPTGHG
jgi:septin 7